MVVCERCDTYLKLTNNTSKELTGSCSVCLGIFCDDITKDPNSLPGMLVGAISKALEPYGGASENRVSVKISPPTFTLPGDLAYRYRHFQNNRSDPGAVFGQGIKQHFKSLVNQCLEKSVIQKSKESFPKAIQDEELGYMSLHIVMSPSKEVYRPEHELPRPKQSREGRKKKYNDESCQGGDPKENLELRLQRQGCFIWSLNQALDKNFRYSDDESQRLTESLPEDKVLDIYVAAWRRPFYIKGCYTKTKRDISQTPFYVTDNGKRQKLGSTSVEEQIAPAITRACHGVSTLNNDDTLAATVYGRAKFHASGREDMDVRMLLPDPPLPNVSGRPFVFEIYDAFRMPSVEELQTISREVNCLDDDNYIGNTPDARSYGRNPSGVGVSSDLHFVPSTDYKNLQADTETKVKHYGCLCWSAKPHSNVEELTAKLGTFPMDINQQTPIRVLHRRANSVRTKQVIHCEVTEYIDEHYFRLHLRTSAGTYVKEFVHGDLGRTIPSVSSLFGCTTDILELDCEGIQMSSSSP